MAWQAHSVAPGRHAIHGTAVSLLGRGLLVLGPSGAGKSTLAAGMIALGAKLVSDDRVEILDDGRLSPPPGAPEKIELRGIGLIDSPTSDAIFAAALVPEPSTARLPDPETIELAGQIVPLLRHPFTPDLAAKLILWLRAAG